jgi:hypothetical protein
MKLGRLTDSAGGGDNPTGVGWWKGKEHKENGALVARLDEVFNVNRRVSTRYT